MVDVVVVVSVLELLDTEEDELDVVDAVVVVIIEELDVVVEAVVLEVPSRYKKYLASCALTKLNPKYPYASCMGILELGDPGVVGLAPVVYMYAMN